jgi:hypothetical protein
VRRQTTLACNALGAGAIVAACWVAVTPTAGCTTHQCDPSTVALPAPGQCPLGTITRYQDGEILWQSSPSEGPWLDFRGQRTYVLTYPQPFASPPMITCYVSADVNNPPSGSVECGGLLAQFSTDAGSDLTSVTVTNLSCAEYGLQVFARGVPASAPSPDITDGGCDGSP